MYDVTITLMPAVPAEMMDPDDLDIAPLAEGFQQTFFCQEPTPDAAEESALDEFHYLHAIACLENFDIDLKVTPISAHECTRRLSAGTPMAGEMEALSD